MYPKKNKNSIYFQQRRSYCCLYTPNNKYTYWYSKNTYPLLYGVVKPFFLKIQSNLLPQGKKIDIE
ncbi:hypothetical protein CAter282_1228 [Collimonas arenae]|uniref:Uncharacterized protein n=1 Tax=Collimonas arenae TaxID=279058 RepID=A0A127PMT8_9BURK|nr:hypothetical protein CAter10_1321 [Collimonas arenae]AMP09020.1 hypothetical protein CAter282_1228 [Collimonas arenae]